MTSFRTVIMDEIDAAPHSVKGEGDPQKLAEARTNGYSGRKKILLISTPLLLQTSKIYKSFLEGDQRHLHIECPFCNQYQKLEWRNFKYKVEKELVIQDSVYFECPHLQR